MAVRISTYTHVGAERKDGPLNSPAQGGRFQTSGSWLYQSGYPTQDHPAPLRIEVLTPAGDEPHPRLLQDTDINSHPITPSFLTSDLVQTSSDSMRKESATKHGALVAGVKISALGTRAMRDKRSRSRCLRQAEPGAIWSVMSLEWTSYQVDKDRQRTQKPEVWALLVRTPRSRLIPTSVSILFSTLRMAGKTTSFTAVLHTVKLQAMVLLSFCCDRVCLSGTKWREF
ncbi:hypothetical protein RRG08_013950 [Elysia crispata]|uniref:Uncharacterized protein n=1 Tax=Elysia crispata TaxID=231223 RepID=A0AAE1ADQ5_9GAST|nr:hypothetical protein RRG08_013950 [Elysia crispata]